MGETVKRGGSGFYATIRNVGERHLFQLEYKNHACKPGMREKIVEMVMNGFGTHDTGRVLGVSKATVTKVLKKRKKFAKPVNKTYLKELEEKKAKDEKQSVNVVICHALAAEMDEMWSFYRQVPPGMAVAGGGACREYASCLCVWNAGT